MYTPIDRYVNGTRIVVFRTSATEPVNLTPEFTAACDPDVSFDGETIIFAGKKYPDDSWQIWRMNTDGSNKLQITRGEDDRIAPIHAGNRFYLNDPQPTPQIIYVSSMHDWKNEHGVGPALSLFGTDPEGKSVHRLTFNLLSDFSPDVLPNGRIVFTSQQHSGDPYQPTYISALMGINNDGTDLMLFHSSHEMPLYKDMIHVSDFDERVYFIETDRSTWLGGGNIAYVSRRRPLHTYHRLSHDKGLFHSPCPLPDGGLVASYRSNSTNVEFGIYRINPKSGKRQGKIFEEEEWHSIDVQVLAPHPKVKGRSNWLIPGSTTGVFYCLNSYSSNLPEGENIIPGSIKYLRVIEGVPLKRESTISEYQQDLADTLNLRTYSGTAFGPRRILGVAPVEKDGSFHIRVPAETPLTFQLLDDNYLALRSQEIWTWVIGNENRGFIGFPENWEMAPPNKMVDAVIKPAFELTLPPEQRRIVDFHSQIAPIIESKCATCHVSGQTLSLEEAKNVRPGAAFSQAYMTLLDPIQGRENERYIVPGNAKQSPLIWHLFGEQIVSDKTPYTIEITSMPPRNALKPKERILFIEWIDLGAQWDSRAAIDRGLNK
ncbi:MAG: hypothetical protein JSU77_09305 [Fidelibacterota bacterium]|nr:MAG: hypothetical protein JSU77_09305 [Candidatus Neomarinimicrobiota bacterium]